MKVTYLNHSGFLLEWEDCFWIFDYYRGALPQLSPQKPVFVFCSHSHGDHFNPEIFRLLAAHPSVRYVFSNEIRKKLRKMEILQEEDIRFLTVRTDAQLFDAAGNAIRIHTLQSTDCGCAFVLEYTGRTVYHAGDLHWWTWPGEPEPENRKMEADYKKEMEYLDGKTVDLAFTPLDPRQEEDYAKGMCYFLSHAQVHHVFPMHFWDDFSVMERFEKEYVRSDARIWAEDVCFHPIRRDGQTWEITFE